MNSITDRLLDFRQILDRLFGRKSARKRPHSPLSVECMEKRELLTAPFLAAAEPSGSVSVQLAPLANVTAGVQEIVTFGMPFTQGSVSVADLANVRVLKNGAEIPAFVEQLTPWRSIDNAAVDGQSVRVARIQIPYTFSSLNPESITVQWGGPARTLNRTTLQDPRIEWHTVTTGTFVAADNVEEPDVLPILPSDYMAKGMFDAQMIPTNSSVAETRDDPAVMNATTFTGFNEFDSAQKNFFYTIINQNPGITVNYKTDPEPWLYDRASAMYALYFRSGFGTALRQAVQASDFYLDHLDSSGFFTLKPGDPKYAYNESLAYTYWLLGDNRVLPEISTVVNAHASSSTRWSPDLNFFTERNAGYKLLANEMAYEVTGGANFKSNVQTIVGDLVFDQNGAGGLLPANRIDGGLYHTGAQHDITEASSADVIIASPWMSVLVVDPMVRVFGVWQTSQVSDFIVRMGNFEKAASKTDDGGQFGGTTRYPDYLMRFDGTSDSRSDTDVQHAMDVGSAAAWATYFASLRGTPDASLRQLANDLYATYDVGVNFWTRPGGTNFNVSPPRRYSWEYKNSDSFSWAMNNSDTTPQPGTLQFSNATYSVNENQATMTITVNRVNGSSGLVSVNFATSDGSATAGADYTASSGTLTFLDGETSKTFTIPIIDDTAIENPETVNLTLSNPTGGATLGATNIAVLIINSDDVAAQPGALQFSAGTFSVNETQGTATITVTRTGGSDGAVSVNFATSNGTATAGSDYTATSGTLTFASGETSKTFTIPIINDTAVENPETVNLTLSNPTGGATLGTTSTAVLTINSDDVAPLPGALQFSAATYSVSETQASVIITVTRTGGSTGAVTVHYATSNGTATAGSDYTARAGTLSFANGQVSKTFSIPIINDTLVENPETVNLTLTSPTGGATLGAPKTAVLTINSDDVAPQRGVLQFSAAAYSVDETQGTATIMVTRTNGSTGAVTVHYATSNGTATAGSDYTARSGTLSFATGQVTKTFTIPIINDTAIEGPETVNLTLTSPTGGATLGTQSTSVLTINSDDNNGQATTASFQQGVNGYVGTTDVVITTEYAQYTEGNGTTFFDDGQLGVYQTTGTNAYSSESLIRFSDLGIPTNATVSAASITLTVENWADSPVIRGYYLLPPWNATPGPSGSQIGWLHRGNGTDWATPGALGQGTDVVAGKSFVIPGITATGLQTITIPLDPAVVQAWINNPGADQGILLVNESPGVIAQVNSSENAAANTRPNLQVVYTVGTPVPQPGTLQLSAATYSVNENQGTATVTVTRTGGSDGAVSINFATSNGTATAGSDYTATSGTLTFAAGETTKTFSIPITNDETVEGNETVNITLSNPTGGATLGGQATAVLTIHDDDVAPQPGALQFNASSFSLAENGGSMTITVTRTGGSTGAVSVQFATSNGTATAGSDYTANSGTLSFADGETSKTFTVAVLDDNAVEGDETFTLTLSNPTGGATLGTPASATFTIVDDDASTGVSLPAGFAQTTIATGLPSLTAMAAAPDGRIFVLEQGGNVRVVKNGALLPTPALTVTTIEEQERGLIGITVDPNFSTNHFIYVTYTVGGPSPAPAHNRVSRFTLNGDVAVPGSEVVLIDLPDVTNRIHNGGALKFGADGKLYIAVGNDNVFGNSQDLTNPFGKILRINPDGTIPTDNPFFNQTTGVNRAIWAYGLRNPYTLDVQPGTGLMYINDVGEASFEEIDQGVAGGNYRWPDSEGYTTNPQFQSPVYAYAHGSGTNQGFAIVGAAFYNPATPTFPSQYAGKYFFADFVNGWISFVDPNAPNPKTPTVFATNIPVRFDGGPVDLEVGTDGALYYLDRFGGGVFKIQFQTTSQAPGITQQPTSQTVSVGQPVTFTVAASSSLPLTYQWQKMDAGTSAFVDIAGATSPSLTLNSTTTADNGDQFRVVVTNSAGSVTSSAAILTVTTAAPPPNGTFTDITDASGISAIIAQKMQEDPNWWLSGEHLVDLDNDGDLDLFLDAHNGDSVVALNNGHGVFSRVTTGSWPSTEVHEMFDINGDGKVDLNATFQDGGSQWWINHSTPGNVNFTATSVTRDGNTSRSQVLMDFNGDGKVDWLRSAPPGLVIDFGDGNGGFTQGSLTFTIPGTDSNDNASFLPGDFDGDGKIDLLILTGGNYDGTLGKTALWHNNGNMTFTDVTASAGIPTNGTIAKGVGDFNQDGNLDFVATENKSMPPVIYLNDGQGHFTKKANAISGVAAGNLDYSFWGTAITTDFDNDGITDIIMAGKYYLLVLRGTGGGNFTNMDNAWGIKDTAAMSVDDGLTFGDIDGDGDLDIIGYDETFPSRTLNVYRNDLAAQNWLNIRPVGLPGNVGAAEATISIFAAGTNQLLWKEQVAQYDFQVATSYYGTSETERHFGLGTRTNVDVVVTFASGKVVHMNNVAANQTIRVLESAGG